MIAKGLILERQTVLLVFCQERIQANEELCKTCSFIVDTWSDIFPYGGTTDQHFFFIHDCSLCGSFGR